jgi:hypothetical protein
VASNQDKASPEGYCAALERQIGATTVIRMTVMDESLPDPLPGTQLADLDGDGLDDVTGLPVAEVEEPPGVEPMGPEDFHALVIVEGIWTGDGRWIEEGALTWRTLPLPLMATDRTTDGHTDAILVGNITRIERMGRQIHAWGTFVASEDEEVLRLQQLIRDGALRGISADLDMLLYDIILPADGIGPDADDSDPEIDEDGSIRMSADYQRIKVTFARVMGATVVPFPAFAEAYIEGLAVVAAALAVERKATGGIVWTFRSLDDIDFSPPAGARAEAERGLRWREEHGRGGTAVGVARARDIANGRNLSPSTITRMASYFARHEVDKQGVGWSPGEDGFPSAGRIAWALWGGDPGRTWAEKVQRQMTARREQGSIVASLHPVKAPLLPPSDWFGNPELSGPTPITITDEGRVFGHVATWTTCHIGFSETCVTPPASASNYAHFHTGELVCSDSSRVAVGQVTMDTGHAPIADSASSAAAHYDHTGAAVVDVRAGEDEHGIWIAGALRPDVAPERIRALMASDVSGDWRRIGASLELVAVLAVNVPGFGKLRVGMRDGLVASVVASLPVERSVSAEVAVPGPASDPGLSRAVERIAATIGRSHAQRRAALASRVAAALAR